MHNSKKFTAMRAINLAVFSLAMPVFGATSIVRIEPTAMQALVTVWTDESGPCSYRASRGSSFSTNIPDLADNGNTDSRPGSIVNGAMRYFILGTRKGSDALAQASPYWVGVTCGVDPEVSQTFTTLPIRWGNTAPDPIPFNNAKFGNRDYPAIDWTNQQKSYVDPVTGVEFWRLTGPGQILAGQTLAMYNANGLNTPIDVAGTGKWANIANLKSNGASFAIANGGPADKVFIPLNAVGNLAGWLPFSSIDDISFDVYCGNAAAAGITLTLQLSQDGGQTVVGSPVTTTACPSGAPVKIGGYPSNFPTPMFQDWGFTPRHNMVAPPSGTVNVSGVTVTLTSQNGSGNYFNQDWAVGTPIMINGSYAHIASLQSTQQLTIAENLGTLTGVSYVGANFGVVITKSSNGNSVAVSVGENSANSSQPQQGTNGTVPMVNLAQVNGVAENADGTGLKDLSGYLFCTNEVGGFSAILLWIPYNADGVTPRSEVRLLSILLKRASSARLHSQGDTTPDPTSLFPGNPFDNINGNLALMQDAANPKHVWKLQYDTTLAGCAGYPAYHPWPSGHDYNPAAPVADDCFQWTNLTPVSAGLDPFTQMKNAYKSGLNVNNQPVGPAHPNFDIGWALASNSFVYVDTAEFVVVASSQADRLSVIAGFDSTTGVLKSISDTWNSGVARWAGAHTVNQLTGGTYKFGSFRNLGHTSPGDPGTVFYSMPQAAVVKVNRANYGATPAWDCNGCAGGANQNTSLSDTEGYNCPTFSLPPYNALSGSSGKCVQLKLSGPICFISPNTTYIFPDGKTEKDEFPCTTPGFGLFNANFSKLQDIQPGDWLYDPVSRRANGTGLANDDLLVLSVTYNSVNDIDVWCMRWIAGLYMAPLFNGNFDERTCGACETRHTDPWVVSPQCPYCPNGDPGNTAYAIDTNTTNGWFRDTPTRSECHSTIVRGAAPDLFTFGEGCDNERYSGQINQTISNMLFGMPTPFNTSWAHFAGSGSGVKSGFSQSYPNGTFDFAKANPAYLIDWRHFNPADGGGTEMNNGVSFGSPINLTLVPGTNKSYSLTDCCSAGAADYKRLGIYGYAGRFSLKDVSSPATGNTGDLPDYSACTALNANECFQGSSAGMRYVTVPFADTGANSCVSSQFTRSFPCVIQSAPWTGQVIQVRTDVVDLSGRSTRKLGYADSGIGLAYGYSNCRATPEANWLFCIGWWLDGVRSEWLALRIAPMTPLDDVDRTTYIPITVNIQGTPGAVAVRARFGYLENGGNLLHCMPYGQDCSTDIPALTPSDPYSFINETVTRQSCASGAACAVTIPALGNRMLYYVVDRLDASGNVVASEPIQVAAVP